LEYQYSKKDHFKFPEKYQRTSFQNLEFLNVYIKSREFNLKNIKENNNEIKNFNDISFKTEEENWKNNNEKSINTEKLLKFLFIKIIKKSSKEEILLNKIIKKFEIKKKIFESYDLEFKENTKKYSNLKNYILLSIICLFKFKKTKNLKFLNTSLKLNDLISSQIKKLIILEDILLYSFVIKKELKIIKILMNKKGISNE
jgi:hypothetical protein